MGLLFASGPAAAAELVWLAPARARAGPLTVGLTLSDGGQATLPPSGKVTITSSTPLRERAASGPVRIYDLDARGDVQLRATADSVTAANATIRVGPPASRVSLTATPPTAIKGDKPLELEISVLGLDGNPDPAAPPPVMRSNVGEIEDLRIVGAGLFRARYVLPKTPYPEVAIVVALAPWPHADAAEGAFGAVAIPLSGAVTLPGKTERNVEISLELAGRTFGPVQSDSRGAFELPIVVPPGHRFAKSRSKDKAGNVHVKQLDLQLPPTDQIACVSNPSSLPADGRSVARILCLAVDQFGAPLDKAKLIGRAALGKLSSPVPRGNGVQEWTYTAPKETARTDELVFEFPSAGQQSTEKVALQPTPTALARAELRIAPQPVFAGSSAMVTLVLADESGRPVQGRPSLSARGAVEPLAEAAPGRLQGVFRPPATLGAEWKDVVSGVVLAASGKVPAHLRVHGMGDQLLVRAEDLGGHPVEGLELRVEPARAATDANGIARFVAPARTRWAEPNEVRVATRPSLSAFAWRIPTKDGVVWFPDEGPFEPISLAVPVQLAPAAAVDLQVELTRPAGGSARARYRVLDLQGTPLPGREVTVAVTRDNGSRVPLGPARPQADGWVELELRESASGTTTVSATDVASGVSASAEVTLP